MPIPTQKTATASAGYARRGMALPLANFMPGLTALSGSMKSFAPSPVWSGSTTDHVTWQRMPKKVAVKLYHRARDFERRTRQRGHQDGALGRNGLAVLHSMIFDFLDYATGRLDPAIATIAQKAAISARSAARGLAKLKAAGVLNWLRRCTGSVKDGRFTLEQDTNAYAILPPTQWRGYTPPAEPPPPESGTWGDPAHVADALTAAITARRDGAGINEQLRHLESDPGNLLAARLASFQRTMAEAQARKRAGFTGLPA